MNPDNHEYLSFEWLLAELLSFGAAVTFSEAEGVHVALNNRSPSAYPTLAAAFWHTMGKLGVIPTLQGPHRRVEALKE